MDVREGQDLLVLPRRDPARALHDAKLRRGIPEAIAIVVGGGAGVAAEAWWHEVTGSAFYSGALGAAVGLLVLWVVYVIRSWWAQPLEQYAELAGAYERAIADRDAALGEADKRGARIRDLEAARPDIEQRPLESTEGSFVPMTVRTTNAAYGYRRIHIRNRGPLTTLAGWEVWITLPGQDPRRARVFTQGEYGIEVDVFRLDKSRELVFEGTETRMDRETTLKAEVPFTIEGLTTEDIGSPGVIMQVRFRDSFGRLWTYGDGPMNRRI